MQKALLFFVMLSAAGLNYGQNLVLNSGFEDSLQCPIGIGVFNNYVANWSKPSYASSDYYYTGCPFAPTDEPPHGGNAYAGVICYDPANYREYITGTLSQPLDSGQAYDVEFYVSLSGGSINGVKEVGAYFSDTNLFFTNTLPIVRTPQIENQTSLIQQNGWEKISGTFVASGGEQYIYIGCFRADSLVSIVPTGGSSGSYTLYYFVDDVSVNRASDDTTGSLSNEVIVPEEDVIAFPNPFTDQLNISDEWSGAVFTLYDMAGRKQLQALVNNTPIITSTLLPGIYFYELRKPDGIVKKGKLLK